MLWLNSVSVIFMPFVEIDGMLSEYFHKSKSRRLFLKFNTERRPEEDMCHAVDKK